MERIVQIPITRQDEAGTRFDFDLSDLTVAEVNSLMLDCVVSLAAVTGERPTDILRSALETAPAGF